MRHLPERNIQSGEYARNVWAVTVEDGTTVEEIQNPEFWRHVEKRFRPFDKIEIHSDSGTWYAEAIVRATRKPDERLDSKDGVQVQLLVSYQLGAETPSEVKDREVKWAGRHAKWRVQRKSDSAVLKEGFETKDSAFAWAAA